GPAKYVGPAIIRISDTIISTLHFGRKELFGRTDIIGMEPIIVTTVTNLPRPTTGSTDSSATSLRIERIVTTVRQGNLDRHDKPAMTRTDVINVIHGTTPSIVRT